MSRWSFLALAAIPLALTTLRPSPPSLIWWTTGAMEKVRPYDKPPEKLKGSVQLFAALNEFEPFQIVFRADSQDVPGVDVEVSDFSGPHGARLSKNNTTVYFERFLDLRRPSSIEGGTGEWPDPLIPRVDRYSGEKRNAFPLSLQNGRNQPIWIEIYVPPATPPGTYSGNVTLWINDKRDATIPVNLQVWNFTLPSTSSLPNSFGFSGLSAVRQHEGRYTRDSDVARYTFLYRKAALWHRLTLRGGTMTPPRVQFTGDKIDIDWKSYDDEVGPFLDGTVFTPSDPLYGAKATSVDLITSKALESDQQKTLYWRAAAQHFRQKDWIDRMFLYLKDEPTPESYPQVLHDARLAHSADKDIHNLVTAPLHPDWTDAIDIWTPLVNCFFKKPEFPGFCNPMADRQAYDTELKQGKKLWWYQSCGSHGCNIVGGEYYRGWPAYMIDASSVSNRIMPWLAWKYGIQGELYFNINEAYARKQDAWNDVYLFGGNGDGTLVYPGRPATIGGKTPIPIESIRLKLIREGLEDYEYLRLLSKYVGASVASDFVDAIVTNAYTYERDPAKLYEIRRKIGEEIASHAHFNGN